MPRATFLSGRVLLDDGTVPAETVVVERVCGTARRPEAQTDSKGRFSFQLGQTRSTLPDAGEGVLDGASSRSSNSTLDPKLLGCELRAVLAGFRSETVSLTSRRVMDHPDVGTIVLHRLGNVEGTTISATSLAAPKNARQAYDKGIDAVKKQEWPEAEKRFEKAVEVYPKYAAAWYELGEVRLKQNNSDGAEKAFEQSMRADAKYLKPYLPAAVLYVQAEQWQQAAQATEKLLRLDPVNYPDALMYNATAYINLHKMDAAEKSARAAVRLDTEHRVPRAQYVLGFILAKKQEYPAALEQMKGYVNAAPGAPDADAVRKQIAELERLVGQPGSAQAEPKQQ
jgi:tetratricopeptide (TPR) repeat protein